MIAAAGIAIGLAVLLFLGRMAFETSQLEDALAEARSSGDLEGLVEAVEAAPADKRPTKWDYALDQLWNAYERETAAELVVEAAPRSDATILQYWIQEVLQVEPKIADRVFSEEFLERHFDPEVASRCGKSGCCP